MRARKRSARRACCPRNACRGPPIAPVSLLYRYGTFILTITFPEVIVKIT